MLRSEAADRLQNTVQLPRSCRATLPSALACVVFFLSTALHWHKVTAARTDAQRQEPAAHTGTPEHALGWHNKGAGRASSQPMGEGGPNGHHDEPVTVCAASHIRTCSMCSKQLAVDVKPNVCDRGGRKPDTLQLSSNRKKGVSNSVLTDTTPRTKVLVRHSLQCFPSTYRAAAGLTPTSTAGWGLTC